MESPCIDDCWLMGDVDEAVAGDGVPEMGHQLPPVGVERLGDDGANQGREQNHNQCLSAKTAAESVPKSGC